MGHAFGEQEGERIPARGRVKLQVFRFNALCALNQLCGVAAVLMFFLG